MNNYIKLLPTLIIILASSEILAENLQPLSINDPQTQKYIDIDSIQIKKKNNLYTYNDNVIINTNIDTTDQATFKTYGNELLKLLDSLNTNKCCITWNNNCTKYLTNKGKSNSDQTGVTTYYQQICSLNNSKDISIRINRNNIYIFDANSKSLYINSDSYYSNTSIYNNKNQLLLKIDVKPTSQISINHADNLYKQHTYCDAQLSQDKSYIDFCKSISAKFDFSNKYVMPKIDFYINSNDK